MTYAISAALQEAVFQRLSADIALGEAVGGAIYDKVPAGALPETYVTLGPEEVRDASDKTGSGAAHQFVVSVVSGEAGFREAKIAASAVSDALVGIPLALARGRLVSLGFSRARARRMQNGDVRRIDLTFVARVEDD